MSNWGLIYLASVALPAAAIAQLLCSRLRRHHATTWEALGRPSVFRASDRSFKPVRDWIRQREFQRLGDPVATRLSRMLVVWKWMIIASLPCMLLWIWLAA
jgi:hypothetical protein